MLAILAVLLFSSATLWLSYNFLLNDYTDNFLALAAEVKEHLKLSTAVKKEKPAEVYVKGLYLTASSVANQKKRQEIINLINNTDLNAVVFDVKDATGYIFYQSQIPEILVYEARKPIIKDLKGVVDEFHQNNIYVIARQVIFLDPVLATAKPDWGVIRKGGGVWRNYKGEKWLDPTVKEVWNYNLKIAKEVVNAGVDEINFDYIRFPSDGPMSLAQYHHPFERKTDTMREFIAYLRENLKDEPVYMSLDFFGLTMDHAADDYDLGIGQNLKVATSTTDYIYPMAYPSHYAPGYLGFSNPAQNPYAVVHNGLVKSEALMKESEAKLRVWLQAFDLGAVYDIGKIKEQIKAVEESPVTKGWVLWNARNAYNYY